jgi:hypothetical protein
MATVTSLAVVHRGGQSFLSFTKNAGAGSGTTYAVRRHTAQITSASDGSLIATLDADSWHYLYADAIAPQLSAGFKIPATAGETGVASVTLASSQGLLVWTTPASGTFYYAVFTSDDPSTVSAGNNTTTSGTVETLQTVPGAVLIGSANQGTYTAYQYFRWEDYAAWRTADWGYYGHHFTAYRYNTGTNLPLTLNLHAAVAGYHETGVNLGRDPYGNGVEIQPNDMQFDTADPYTGGTYLHSRWSGRLNSTTSHLVPITERRITDYCKMVRDSATGEGTAFQVDSARLYAIGSSLGSGASHVVSHYPTLFAAVSTSLTYVRPVDDNSVLFGYGAITAAAAVVDVAGSPAFGDWFSIQKQAENGIALPPALYTYNKDDSTVLPWGHPELATALETAKRPYAMQWHDGNHGQFTIGHFIDSDNSLGSGLQWDLLRFRRTEAYPAFGSVSTSDAVGTIDIASHINATGAAGNTGQRNYWLDWFSSLHTFGSGSALTDSASTFGISLKSLLGTATGISVTIRNAQTFLPVSGAVLTWSTDNAQSGSATRNADGSVTVTGLSIPTTPIRLTISVTSSPSQSPSASLSSSPSASVSPSSSTSPSSSVSPSPSPGGHLPHRDLNARMLVYLQKRYSTSASDLTTLVARWHREIRG